MKLPNGLFEKPQVIHAFLKNTIRWMPWLTVWQHSPGLWTTCHSPPTLVIRWEMAVCSAEGPQYSASAMSLQSLQHPISPQTQQLLFFSPQSQQNLKSLLISPWSHWNNLQSSKFQPGKMKWPMQLSFSQGLLHQHQLRPGIFSL